MATKALSKQQQELAYVRENLPDAGNGLLIQMRFLNGSTVQVDTYTAALQHIRAYSGNHFVPTGWENLDAKYTLASLMLDKAFCKTASVVVSKTIYKNKSKIK